MGIIGAGLLAGLLLVAAAANGSAVSDKVVFLDVGQGDAILFQDGSRQVLIDGGEGSLVVQRLGEQMSSFDRFIEVVILSHPQQDHMEGLLHVLERFDVGMVLLPYAPNTSQLQRAWIDMLLEKGVSVRYSWTGQQLSVGDMHLKVLGPFDSASAQAATRSDVNNASTMVRVDFHDMSFLLTGDAEKRVEQMMIENIPADVLDIDVLKAGHHGSNSSTHAPLLQATSPAAVVISVGADNQFGHPHADVLRRIQGIPIWRTDQDGSVKFFYGKDGWIVQTNKASLSDIGTTGI